MTLLWFKLLFSMVILIYYAECCFNSIREISSHFEIELQLMWSLKPSLCLPLCSVFFSPGRCPACFRCFPAPTHLLGFDGSLTDLCRPRWQADGDPLIWIRLFGAGKYLKSENIQGCGSSWPEEHWWWRHLFGSVRLEYTAGGFTSLRF